VSEKNYTLIQFARCCLAGGI